MKVPSKIVERRVEDVLNAFDALTGSIIAQTKYPLDAGFRAQHIACEQEMKMAFLNLLQLIEMKE
jgi:hypothetical protein